MVAKFKVKVSVERKFFFKIEKGKYTCKFSGQNIKKLTILFKVHISKNFLAKIFEAKSDFKADLCLRSVRLIIRNLSSSPYLLPCQ